MTNEERATGYDKAIRKALKSFGEYSYHDKGPQEVMDVPGMHELSKVSVDDIAETLKLVLKKNNRHGERFVQAVVMNLQDWGKFDELLDKHKWLAKHY
jgi:hypothetical protein